MSKSLKKLKKKFDQMCILPLLGSIGLLDSNNAKNNEGFYPSCVCSDIFWQNTQFFWVTWE